MESGYLELNNNNTMYYEINGNNNGIPLLFIHGGPASGIGSKARKNVDLDKYMLIEYDQRGCGNSKPTGILENNNTSNLVEDIELLRKHLNIESLIVAGYSWGSTLALLYTQQYPQHVKQLHVGGLFLAREKSLSWYLNKNGVETLVQDYYKKLLKYIPNTALDYKSIAQAYIPLLADHNANKQAVIDYANYQDRLAIFGKMESNQYSETLAIKMQIMNHYLANDFFLTDNQIINNIDKINNIDLFITQGRLDLLCPVGEVYDLLENFKGTSQFDISEDSLHCMSQGGINIFYGKINKSN